MIFFFPHVHGYSETTINLSNPYTEAAAALAPEEKARWANYEPAQQLALAYADKWIGCRIPEVTLGSEGNQLTAFSSFRGKKVLLALSGIGRDEKLERLLNTLAPKAKDAVVLYASMSVTTSDFPTPPPFLVCGLADFVWLPELLRPSKYPVLLIVDRVGVLQAVYGGKEPVEEMCSMLEGADYAGLRNVPPPPLIPEAKALPSRPHILVKVWSIKTDSFMNSELQQADDTPELELVLTSNTECLVYASEGKLLTKTRWAENYSVVDYASVTKTRTGFLFAVADENEERRTLDLRLLDDRGSILWSYPVDSCSSPFLGWFDVDSDGLQDIICSLPCECLGIAYSVSGKPVMKDSPPESMTTAVEPMHPARMSASISFQMSPEGVVHRKNAKPLLIARGPHPHELCLMEPGTTVTNTYMTTVDGKPTPVFFSAMWDSHSQELYFVFQEQFGPLLQEYLIAADSKGNVLWRKRKPFATSGISDSIGLADYDGDGVSEWVMLRRRDILLFTREGRPIAEIPLHIDPGNKRYVIDPRTRNLIEADPATAPSGTDRMRVIQRESKPDLILLDEGRSWTAWEIRPVAVN